MSFFAATRDMGIDLGTSNTLLYIKEKGILLREPSVVAINATSRQVLAIGSEAKKMIGRTPENISTIRPLKAGVVANFDVAQQMLNKFVEKVRGRKGLNNSRIVICHPAGVTEVEKRAIGDAAAQCGTRKAVLIEEPIAAAIGAGLPVAEPIGSMIIDIGGGTTDIAAISLGGIVTSNTLKIGGDNLDESIIEYVKKQYNLMIGEITAENIKIKLGSAYAAEVNEDKNMQITGRDLMTGLPRVITVTDSEIRRALRDPLSLVIEAIRTTIEQTPPELSADIMENGITLSGGGALLKDLDKLIYNEIHMPVNIAENPLDCVVLGAGRCLEHLS
jgi:rod shape-determining protein MreB